MPDVTLVVLGVIVAVFAALVVGGAALAARRERSDASRSLSAIDFVRTGFAGRRRKGEPLDALLREMAEALAASFRLDRAEIWVTDAAGGLERRFSSPEGQPARRPLTPEEETVIANSRVSGAAWLRMWLPELAPADPDAGVRTAPVTHQGTLLGLILAVRRGDAERLAEDADVTLSELAREVGVAIQTARLDSALERSLADLRRHAAELQASRARIVAAADTERRKIERDLHDGAQQELVGLAVKTALLRELVERDPVAARQAVDELSAEIAHAIDSLRSLAHGIYPPLLADEGLVRALATAGRRSVLSASVDAEGVGRYPAEVESAVYFCCLEALQNAGKHAGEGASARLRLAEEAGSLVFEVVDDGRGFDPGNGAHGTGLTNMRDRIGALGGVLELTSRPGEGTRLVGRIPLPK